MYSFITYRSCKHLDGKHTVFGKLVGGMETLNKIEQIEVDNNDLPIEDIVIVSIEVFVDPFQEALDQLAQDRSEFAKTELEKEKKVEKKGIHEPLKAYGTGVGKYLNLQALKNSSSKDDSITAIYQSSIKKSKAKSQLNHFSSW